MMRSSLGAKQLGRAIGRQSLQSALLPTRTPPGANSIKDLVRLGRLGHAEAMLWASPDVHSCETVIGAYARRRHRDKVEWVAEQARRLGVIWTPDIHRLICIARAMTSDPVSALASLTSLAASSCSTNAFERTSICVIRAALAPEHGDSLLDRVDQVIDEHYDRYDRRAPSWIHEMVVRRHSFHRTPVSCERSIRRMQSQGYVVPPLMCRFLLLCYADDHSQRVPIRRCWEIWHDLIGARSPDYDDYRAMLIALSRSDSTTQSMLILKTALADPGIVPSASLFTPTLAVLARKGRRKLLRNVVHLLQLRSVRPTTSTFNTVLHSHIRCGDINSAKELLLDFLANDCLDPDLHTFTIMLEGSRSKRDCDMFFELIAASALVPNIVTMNVFVNTLFRLDLHDHADHVLCHEMPAMGIIPNERTIAIVVHAALKQSPAITKLNAVMHRCLAMPGVSSAIVIHGSLLACAKNNQADLIGYVIRTASHLHVPITSLNIACVMDMIRRIGSSDLAKSLLQHCPASDQV